MNVRVYQPQSKLLQKYIAFFYLLSQEEDEAKESYFTFPSVYNFVSVLKDVKTVAGDYHYKIIAAPGRKMQSDIVVRYNRPLLFEYCGKILEITIVFKPLGINAFFTDDLLAYRYKTLNKFYPCPGYEENMLHILAQPNAKVQIEMLENYLLSAYRGFLHPFLTKAVELLQHGDGEIKIDDVAETLGITRKTLHKHFLLYAGRTPSEFRKVARFRKVLSKKVYNAGAGKLTSLAHYGDYFDQAHMVKEFKSLTHTSPRNFFSKLTTSENGLINWAFT